MAASASRSPAAKLACLLAAAAVPRANADSCTAASFDHSKNDKQCSGLGQAKNVKDANGCALACCKDAKCTMYQWAAGGSANPKNTCWIGNSNKCSGGKGWVGGVKGKGPAPGPGPSPPGTPAPPSQSRALQRCLSSCIDAGHCEGTGEVCTIKQSGNHRPSCAQGCLAAEYYAAASDDEDAAMTACTKACGDNGNTCDWKDKDNFAGFNNCGNCAPDPTCAGGGTDGSDGQNGQECKEGCRYLLLPTDPVCGKAAPDTACVGDSPTLALKRRLGVAVTDPEQCDQKTCTDWETCQIWCQQQDGAGCCSYDNKKCSFVNGAGVIAGERATGSLAALCAPMRWPSAVGGSGGCDGGCAFLIIFFVGGFTYFATGFAYNYKRRDLRGVEAIPNREFWVDVPYLVKDGVSFTVAKAKSMREGYSSV